MAFSSSIAGPSRIPLQACASSCRRSALAVSRSYSTASDEGESTAGTNAAAAFYGTDLRGGRDKIRGISFSVWKRTSGRDLEYPEKGQKAKWLGGNVPYPMNPSFRPPPPLGDEMQEALYREMQSGKKTLGEISAEYNVGRARLDAIRKLKEIEAEYRRQSLPLQTAFKEGMEPLLGSSSIVQARWSRDDGAARAGGNESVAAEADEERRWMAGIGDGGAFGNRNKEEEGIERTVFDWRAEDDLLDAKAAGLEESVFQTPDTEKAQRQARMRALKSQRGKLPELIIPTKAPTTTWRFVDVSRVGIPQHPQVVHAMEKRTKLTEKKAAQRRKKKGVFE